MTAPVPGSPRLHPSPPDGEPEVFTADEQADHAVDLDRWRELAEGVLAAERLHGAVEVGVLFVDRTAMTDLNLRFMGGDGPTDVLAFPIDDMVAGAVGRPAPETTGPDRDEGDDEAPLLLGDVVVCPSVAIDNAPTHAGSPDDELALVIVHGLLHLLGMDHQADEEAATMRTREQDLLGRLHGPLTGDPWAEPSS